MSGIELAREVIWKCRREEIEVPPALHMDKGPEYWAGWAAAYFQWESALTLRKIDEAVPFASILKMYRPYHEMDITQFSDEMRERTASYRRTSSLKRLRRYAGLTQRELADESGVPLRTVQQYEQGQKDLSRAAAEAVRRLSAALHCREEDLL